MTLDLDADLQLLRRHADSWARADLDLRLDHLRNLRRRTAGVAERWVGAATRAKGLAADSPWIGEEWMSGPYALLCGINALETTLTALAAGQSPIDGLYIISRGDDQIAVAVYPVDASERLLLSGVRAEVRMEPGVTAENVADHVAGFYRRSAPDGRVALVLGAGNINSIAPLDVLHKLYAEGQVVMLKLNPVNAYMGPILEEIFADMAAAGWIRFAAGGAEVGAYLTAHPDIDEIHMTGSEQTFNAIVFGRGEEGERRRLAGERRNQRRITAELGGIGPTIVVPGPWSAADLKYQAAHLATQKLHNAGCNCIASQVVVLPKAWDLKDALLDAYRDVVRSLPPRAPYYPGFDDRQRAAVAAHPDAEILDGDLPDGFIPRTLITGLDPEAAHEPCFDTEFFCHVHAVTELDGDTPAEFLECAVDFANNRLAGTLGANLLIHPATIRELGPALDDAIDSLRYGCVGVNAWAGLGYLLARCSWGAFPGHTDDDIQSGRGTVHNALLFDRPQKSVVTAPFAPFPRTLASGRFHLLPIPPWFVTHRRAAEVGRRLTFYAADPGPMAMPGIFAAALRP